jgi:hypothetical protein
MKLENRIAMVTRRFVAEGARVVIGTVPVKDEAFG